MKSSEFWNKMNFKTVKYDMARDKGENPLIWHPAMDREMTPGESA